jgi:glyoxylase-like metal-dependent hydrolase (beta-lactamase superfamily II)
VTSAGAPRSHLAPIRVGSLWVHVVCEGWAPLELAGELPGTSVPWSEERSRYPWAFLERDAWPWHVHPMVVEGPREWIAVDTGLGAFPPYAPWGPNAARPDAWSYVDLRAVRHVVHSHLHADHAGGAVVDAVPRYPEAVHHLHRADWEHYAGADDERDYVARHAMEPLVESGALSLSTDDVRVAPGVEVIHTPGHTPGHRSVLIRDGGDALLITGDLLHLPTQVEHRDRPSSHDVDPGEGVRSRKALLDRAEAEGWTVAVPHFAEPHGFVRNGRWSAAIDPPHPTPA